MHRIFNNFPLQIDINAKELREQDGDFLGVWKIKRALVEDEQSDR